MKKISTLICMLLLTFVAKAQTTIGLTQPIDEVNKTYADMVWTGMDNVSIEQKYGSAISYFPSKGATPTLNGTQLAKSGNGENWRKSVKTYDNQWIGYEISVAEGYALNLSKVEARIVICDDTYNWYVQILDANETELYKSSELETKKGTTASLAEALSLKKLSGKVYVRLYVKQGGSTKYFIADKLTVDATLEVDARPTHDITTSVAEGDGSVSPEGVTAYIEGEDAVLTANPAVGYKFVKWIVDGVESTTNPYTISNITTAHSAVAYFEALPILTFAKPEDVICVNRMFLSKVNTYDAGETYTLPNNYMYYKEGYTLVGWSDGTNEYACGEEYVVNGDATITPVFRKNNVSLEGRTSATTITYDFATKTNGGRIINIEGNADYIITRATVDGEDIDVALYVDCNTGAGFDGVKGKVNNTSGDNRAQVNKGSVFYVPVVKGTVIKYTITNGTAAVDGVTFDGANATSAENKVITYEYTGEEAKTIKVIDQGKAYYPSGIAVTYPKPSYNISINTTVGYGTLYYEKELAIPADTKAYTGELVGNSLVLTELTDVIPAKTAVIVSGNGGLFEVSNTGATFDGTNDLKGTASDLAVSEVAGGTVCVLGYENSTAAFYKYSGATLAANKAYLVVPESASAKGVNIVFDTPTAVDGVEVVDTDSSSKAAYNFAGQQVNANAKGLVIVGGKKFFNK